MRKYQYHYGTENKNPSQINYENDTEQRTTLYFRENGYTYWQKWLGSPDDFLKHVMGQDNLAEYIPGKDL
jgi:hypothetical protein